MGNIIEVRENILIKSDKYVSHGEKKSTAVCWLEIFCYCCWLVFVYLLLGFSLFVGLVWFFSFCMVSGEVLKMGSVVYLIIYSTTEGYEQHLSNSRGWSGLGGRALPLQISLKFSYPQCE